MSKVVATTVLPEDSGEVLTFGDTGDAIAISGDSLNLNVIQDAGGNNIITSDGGGTLTLPSAFGGAFNLLMTNTFTDTTTSSFITLIDSTYDVYCFRFNAINPATNEASFRFQGSTNRGSSYGVTKTTTWFYALHNEADTSGLVSYAAGLDLAQSTNAQIIASTIGNDADACATGEFWLFTPSNTTYIKQFLSTTNTYRSDDETQEAFMGGYFNTTSAINAIQFSMSSGNMDGEIKMYGISKS